MRVILGPAATESTSYGSRTSASSIPGLMSGLHRRDPGKWVAGHLLNDNLGGSGKRRANLTPLTQNANKRHSCFENKLTRLCYYASLYHGNNPKADFWYGIDYVVKVSGETFGDFKPYNGAPFHIIIEANVVTVDKKSGTIIKAAAGIPEAVPAASCVASTR